MFHNLNKFLNVEQRPGAGADPEEDHPVVRHKVDCAAAQRAALQGERLAGGTR